MQESNDGVELVERVAALDIGKADLVACVRVPHDSKPGRRVQEVRSFPTTLRGMLELRDWARCWGVSRLAMESTSDYWKAPYYALEDHFEQVWLLNASHVKNVPGRPKTDKLDAIWLAKVTEMGMCRPSFVPPKPIRQLRDLTRYRRTLIRERTREKQRVEKLLEDAQIKLSAVISDIFGVSGRLMLQALVDGERSPKVLAQLARGTMRNKISVLEEALAGHFDDRHAFLLRTMLRHIDYLTTDIAEVTTQIQVHLEPYRRQVAQLLAIPGVGATGAQELIAEIGLDMSAFPSSDHLVSWAKFAPKARESAGKKKGNSTTGKGNPWLGGTLGEIAIGASRTNTFLGARYKRVARRRGKKRALVATGNSVLTIVYHLLSDPETDYQDLGPDHYDSRINKQRRARTLMRQIEQLTGHKVTLQPLDTTAA